MRKALTQAAIAKLRPGDYLADTNTPGLRVEASASTKILAYRFRELVVNGKPMTNEQLAQLVGLTARNCAKLVRA